MRKVIELLEDKEKLEQTELPYGRGALAPVLSKTNIDNH